MPMFSNGGRASKMQKSPGRVKPTNQSNHSHTWTNNTVTGEYRPKVVEHPPQWSFGASRSDPNITVSPL